MNGKQFKGFLNVRKVSGAIDGYKQQMDKIKSDYIVSTGSCTLRYISDSPILLRSMLLLTCDSRCP